MRMGGRDLRFYNDELYFWRGFRFRMFIPENASFVKPMAGAMAYRGTSYDNTAPSILEEKFVSLLTPQNGCTGHRVPQYSCTSYANNHRNVRGYRDKHSVKRKYEW